VRWTPGLVTSRFDGRSSDLLPVNDSSSSNFLIVGMHGLGSQFEIPERETDAQGDALVVRSAAPWARRLSRI
jgi:hypothetical protein